MVILWPQEVYLKLRVPDRSWVIPELTQSPPWRRRGWKGASWRRAACCRVCAEKARGPEELLGWSCAAVLELPERLEAEDELEPLLEPVLVLEPELEVELDWDLRSRKGRGHR